MKQKNYWSSLKLCLVINYFPISGFVMSSLYEGKNSDQKFEIREILIPILY